MRQFFRLHMLAILAHLVCAVYAFMTQSSYDTLLTAEVHRVSFEDSYYFTKGDTMSFTFPSVGLLHGIVAIITLCFHIFIYIPVHYSHAQKVWLQGFFAPRWIEYSLTCTLMTLASVQSSGNLDLNLLITIAFASVALQLIGLCIEQLKDQWRILLFIGLVIEFAISWPLIWYNFTTSGITVSQFVELSAYSVFYGLFPLNCVMDAVYRKDCFVRTDWFYNVLSLTSKFALFWLQVGDVERTLYGGIWPELQIYVLGLILPFMLLAIGIFTRPSCTLNLDQQPNTTFKSWYWLTELRIPKSEKIVYIQKKVRRRP